MYIYGILDKKKSKYNKNKRSNGKNKKRSNGKKKCRYRNLEPQEKSSY